MSFSSPQNPNPFAEIPANPYAAPSYLGQDPLLPLSRGEARLRVLGPALGLGISSLLALLFGLFALTMFFIDEGDNLFTATEPAELVGEIIGIGICVAVLLFPPVVTLAGAVQMLRLKTYHLCFGSALVGAIPCTVCFPLVLPFGIWGLVALWNVRVRDAFRLPPRTVSR